MPGTAGSTIHEYKPPACNLSDQTFINSGCRSQKKSLHWISNTVAVLLVDLGLLAAVQSHNLKRPSPIPNFYSTHSYMGLLIVILLNIQVGPKNL